MATRTCPDASGTGDRAAAIARVEKFVLVSSDKAMRDPHIRIKVVQEHPVMEAGTIDARDLPAELGRVAVRNLRRHAKQQLEKMLIRRPDAASSPK